MIAGADLGFQVRGGALKKIAPSGGRREQFWGISCEKFCAPPGLYIQKSKNRETTISCSLV